MDNKTQWITLIHQLPEVGKPILGLNASTGEMNVVYPQLEKVMHEYPRKSFFVNSMTFCVKTNHLLAWGETASFTDMVITHWMPLPEPIK